jgi:hypothetical protein
MLLTISDAKFIAINLFNASLKVLSFLSFILELIKIDKIKKELDDIEWYSPTVN